MDEPVIKVLLADDHPVVREGLRSMLRATPDIVVVGEADDGQAAVQGVSSHHPDVVLMEIHMPSVDGLEATRLIKRQSPHTAVVVFTMYDNDTFVVDAVRAGASGYLLKDASRDLILHTIRAVNSGGTLIKTSLLQEALRGQDSAPGTATQPALPPGPEAEELSLREMQVLHMVAEGSTNKEIATTLFIGGDTVKKHVQNIIAKLGAADRTQAAVMAVRMGLVK